MHQALNTLYVMTQGTYAHLDHDTVRLEVERETVLRVPLLQLGAVVCFGNVLVSPMLMHRCAEDGRAVVLLDRNGRFKARVEGPVSGNVLLRPADAPPEMHTHLEMEFDDGTLLRFVDPRTFGEFFLAGPDELDHIGPDALDIDVAQLRAAFAGRQARVKSLLVDQRALAGIGNIYADEALFRAGVHPLRAVGRLTSAQWERLRVAVEAALAAGIDAKGASIDDFRHVDGARGSFQDRFLIHLRAGQPCLACGRPVRKIVVGGRGTYVCERCQPRPRQPRRPRRAGPQ